MKGDTRRLDYISHQHSRGLLYLGLGFHPSMVRGCATLDYYGLGFRV